MQVAVSQISQSSSFIVTNREPDSGQIEVSQLEDTNTVDVSNVVYCGEIEVNQHLMCQEIKLSKPLDFIRGDKGDKGDQGEPGKSAYEIAVEHGFVGTEQEWIDKISANDPIDEVLQGSPRAISSGAIYNEFNVLLAGLRVI